MMEDMQNTQAQTNTVSPVQDATKKPYLRPELVRYGDLKKLTLSNNGVQEVDFEGYFS